MINFQVVEKPYDNMNHIYEDFKKDFINPEVKVKELKQKYDLSPAKYRDLKNRVQEETGLTKKPSIRGYGSDVLNENKFISKTNDGSYVIYKTLNNHRNSYGSYKDIETAKFVRNKLIENNWDKEIAIELKKEYGNIRCIPSLERAMVVYDDFEKSYLNNSTRREITSELGISHYQYYLLAKIVREKYNLPPKRGRKKY